MLATLRPGRRAGPPTADAAGTAASVDAAPHAARGCCAGGGSPASCAWRRARHPAATGGAAGRRVRLDDRLRRRAAAARARVQPGWRRPRAARVEVFTLGTRLTRVTRALRHPRPGAGAARGRRAGAGLVRRHPARRDAQGLPGPLGTARDGPRRGRRGASATAGSAATPPCSASRCARLHRLAHRVVWVNPHRGTAGFQPVQRGWRRRCRTSTTSSPGTRCATFARADGGGRACVRCCTS